MFCCTIAFLLVGWLWLTAADSDVNHVITSNATVKCAGKKDDFGELCDPSACQQLNVSCPLIPNVLCASDECGCQLAFTAAFAHLGRGSRKDVTDLCQATAAIKASTEIMDGLLSGASDKRSIVAANPEILFLLFKGLNTLSMATLKHHKQGFQGVYSQLPSFYNYERLQFFITAESALEKRIGEQDVDRQEKLTTNSKELERRERQIRRWIAKQEKVILAEDISPQQALSHSRTPSRKYTLDRDGHIVAARWPGYRNLFVGLLERNIDVEAMGFVSLDSQRKLGEIRNLLNFLLLDEAIAARQAPTRIPAAIVMAGQPGNSTMYARRVMSVSSQTVRSQYDFNSFAPLFIAKSDQLNWNKICDLFNQAIQIAALGIDLYNSIFSEVSGPLSDQEMANYLADWNTADEWTEYCF